MKKKTPTVSMCFACDGTGKTCNICGEAPQACGCDEVEIEEYCEEYGEQYGPCESCGGTGK